MHAGLGLLVECQYVSQDGLYGLNYGGKGLYSLGSKVLGFSVSVKWQGLHGTVEGSPRWFKLRIRISWRD